MPYSKMNLISLQFPEEDTTREILGRPESYNLKMFRFKR